jgi:hypothetical protein
MALEFPFYELDGTQSIQANVATLSDIYQTNSTQAG